MPEEMRDSNGTQPVCDFYHSNIVSNINFNDF